MRECGTITHDFNGKRYKEEYRSEKEGRGSINHTNTTRCYVGSNHDWALASLELVQNPVTLVLLFVAMDS